jgi:hypothetical protein
MATEILGILVTVILIDGMLNYNEKRKANTIQKIAIRKLGMPLRSHFDFLTKIYKATINAEINEKYDQYSDLFSERFYSQIKIFDFSKPAPVIPQKSWAHYTCTHFVDFKNTLDQIMDRYQLFLTPNTLDLIECITSSCFHTMMINCETVLIINENEKILPQNNNLFSEKVVVDSLKEHISLLSELIDIYNTNFPENKININYDIFKANHPKIGSARTEI